MTGSDSDFAIVLGRLPWVIAFGVPSAFIPAFARAWNEKTWFLCQILPFCAIPSFDKLRAARVLADGRDAGLGVARHPGILLGIRHRAWQGVGKE